MGVPPGERRILPFRLCFPLNGRKHTPRAPLTNFNDGEGGGGGGPTEVHILYPKKSQLQEFVYPEKSLLFLAYPKKSLKSFFRNPKNPSVILCDPPKIPASFIDPKKSLLPKFQIQKITRTSPSLTYVSRAPGKHTLIHPIDQ